MLAVIAAIENDIEREFITKIYCNYYKVLLEKAYFIVKNREESEEVVQEAFIKLIEHVSELMGYSEVHIFNYSKVTVKNIAINHLNRNNREKKRQFSADEEGFDYWISSEAALPEDLFIHTEDMKNLLAAIKKLNEQEQSLLENKYILNMSDTEIAKNMNISPSSVRCYLTRARRRAFALMTK